MKWESWTKAFEVAAKSDDSGGSQRATFELPPPEFAKALRELDREREGLSSGDSRYQAACALGELTWFDEYGRRVSLVRHGSMVSRYEADGRERQTPDSRLVGIVGGSDLRGKEATSIIIDEPVGLDPGVAAALEEGHRSRDAAMAPFGPPPPAPPVEISTSKGKITVPPGLEDAEVRSVSYAGNVAVQAPEKPATGIVAAVKSVLPKGKKK